MTKPRISLALSGGGARGLAHIGVIEELEDQGYTISSIAGTSMGALVGGVYAAGAMPAFKEWMLTLDKIKMLRLVDFSFSTQGLIKGDRVFNKMRDYLSQVNIEDLDIPFCAVAVDIVNKQEVVFSSGDIYKAIRASVSIPSVFTPVKREKALLVDGGVLNNIPVNHVKRIRGDMLAAVDVNASIPPVKPEVSEEVNAERQGIYQEKMKQLQKHLKNILPANSRHNMGYFELMTETISLMTNTISGLILEKFPPDLLISISRQSAGTFDFYRAEELIEIGHIVTRQALENLNDKK